MFVGHHYFGMGNFHILSTPSCESSVRDFNGTWGVADISKAILPVGNELHFNDMYPCPEGCIVAWWMGYGSRLVTLILGEWFKRCLLNMTSLVCAVPFSCHCHIGWTNRSFWGEHLVGETGSAMHPIWFWHQFLSIQGHRFDWKSARGLDSWSWINVWFAS